MEMIRCPHDGMPADVRKTEDGYEVECPACHLSESGETLEQAARCFEADGPAGKGGAAGAAAQRRDG